MARLRREQELADLVPADAGISKALLVIADAHEQRALLGFGEEPRLVRGVGHDEEVHGAGQDGDEAEDQVEDSPAGHRVVAVYEPVSHCIHEEDRHAVCAGPHHPARGEVLALWEELARGDLEGGYHDGLAGTEEDAAHDVACVASGRRGACGHDTPQCDHNAGVARAALLDHEQRQRDLCY